MNAAEEPWPPSTPNFDTSPIAGVCLLTPSHFCRITEARQDPPRRSAMPSTKFHSYAKSPKSPKSPKSRTSKSRLFNPSSQDFFCLSRTKINDFLNCRRCFYLDRRIGLKKPSLPAFSLNIAVDCLLKGMGLRLCRDECMVTARFIGLLRVESIPHSTKAE